MQNASGKRTETRSFKICSRILVQLLGIDGADCGKSLRMRIAPSMPLDSYLRLVQEAGDLLQGAVHAANEGDLVSVAELTIKARQNVRVGSLLLRIDQENDQALLNIIA